MRCLTKIIVALIIALTCRGTEIDDPSLTDYWFMRGNERLVTVEMDCFTFDGKTRRISIQVLDTLSSSAKKIFEELHKKRFPIYIISCYKWRPLTEGKTLSLHAYGAAIDVNYVFNRIL